MAKKKEEKKRKTKAVLIFSASILFDLTCILLWNLQRLAGSEEVLPVPDFNQLIDSTAAKEIENSVRASLLQVGFSFFFRITCIHFSYAGLDLLLFQYKFYRLKHSFQRLVRV